MDDQSDDAKAMSIQVFLDDDKLPLATYRPPATLTIDTRKLEDGEHVLRLPCGRRPRQRSASVRFPLRSRMARHNSHGHSTRSCRAWHLRVEP